MQTGILWTFLSCIKGVNYPFAFQEGMWGFSRDTALEKGLISHRGRNVVFLELRQEPWGSSRVATGISGTSSWLPQRSQVYFRVARVSSGFLSSRCWRMRAVSRVQSGNSVFLSSGVRDLGLPIKVQQGSQASRGVEAWNSTFLSSCQRGIRPPVESGWGIGAFSRG